MKLNSAKSLVGIKDQTSASLLIDKHELFKWFCRKTRESFLQSIDNAETPEGGKNYYLNSTKSYISLSSTVSRTRRCNEDLKMGYLKNQGFLINPTKAMGVDACKEGSFFGGRTSLSAKLGLLIFHMWIYLIETANIKLSTDQISRQKIWEERKTVWSLFLIKVYTKQILI